MCSICFRIFCWYRCVVIGIRQSFFFFLSIDIWLLCIYRILLSLCLYGLRSIYWILNWIEIELKILSLVLILILQNFQKILGFLHFFDCFAGKSFWVRGSSVHFHQLCLGGIGVEPNLFDFEAKSLVFVNLGVGVTVGPDRLRNPVLKKKKVLKQGYLAERLKSSFRKFYGRYGDLIQQYEVSLSQMLNDILILDQQWLPNQSDFPPISWPWYRAWPSPIMSGFHGAFATGVACQQGTLTLPDTWFRPPFWDLLMLQLLRPNSSNLPCLYSTFHLEYPLVLSRFCFKLV